MKQSEKLTQLLELMQANQELPVIPCVDGDVVSGDEYYCWLGSWGESAVQELFTRDRARNRAKTFPGVARAFAEQFGGQL